MTGTNEPIDFQWRIKEIEGEFSDSAYLRHVGVWYVSCDVKKRELQQLELEVNNDDVDAEFEVKT